MLVFHIFAVGAHAQIAVILRSKNRLMKCRLLMNNLHDHAKQSSRRKRLALLVALITLCVVVAYMFIWRTAGISNATVESAAVLKRDQALNALLNSKSNRARDAGMARPQTPPADSSAWRTILDNLTALLNLFSSVTPKRIGVKLGAIAFAAGRFSM